MARRDQDQGRDTTRGDTSNRGFASMDPDKQRAIAAEGGRAAHAQGVAHEFDSEEARQAGRKGGQSRGGSDNEDNRNLGGNDRDMQGADRGEMQAAGRRGLNASGNQGRDSQGRDSQGRFTDSGDDGNRSGMEASASRSHGASRNASEDVSKHVSGSKERDSQGRFTDRDGIGGGRRG